MPIFLIPRMLLLNVWCDACSNSVIGESNGKSRLAKIFSKFLRTREIWWVERGGGGGGGGGMIQKKMFFDSYIYFNVKLIVLLKILHL